MSDDKRAAAGSHAEGAPAGQAGGQLDRCPADHAGGQAVAAARAHGVGAMFTLSGGHVFPLYDGAVRADPPMRLVDVRHEQTAVFAAEA
ncbi:MAG: thiamine pyrophosphate-binding protein, partial [Streptosporangiaceae bacterium]